MDGVLTRAGIMEAAKHGMDSLSLYGSSSVCLVTAGLSPGLDTTLAAVTEAAFTGYARQAFTPASPAFDGGNEQGRYINDTVLVWNGPSDNTGVHIVGWVLYTGTGSVTLASGLLAAAVPLNATTDQLAIIPEVRVGGVAAVAEV